MTCRRPFRAYSGSGAYAFVSYSHRNAERVYEIINRVFQLGCNIWYDQGIENNTALDREITRRIKGCAVFVAFLSPEFVGSKYVMKNELPAAKRGGKNIIYVLTDPNDECDYSSVTGGAKVIAGSTDQVAAELARIMTGVCRDCEMREPQPIEVDMTTGLVFVNEPIPEFYFTIKNGGIVITGFNDDDWDGGEIVVPRSHKGFPVTEIGSEAFSMQHGADSVILPDTIKRIGESSFFQMDFERMELPFGVEEIGEDAFEECENLTEMILPRSLEKIGISAFFSCSSLTEIIIPDSVKMIGQQAFDNCPLERIVIPPQVETIGKDAFSAEFNWDEVDSDEPDEDEIDDEDEREDSAVVVCCKGSAAHDYALKHRLKCELISEAEMAEIMDGIGPKERPVTDEPIIPLDKLFSGDDTEKPYAALVYDDRYAERIEFALRALYADGYRLKRIKGGNRKVYTDCEAVLLFIDSSDSGDVLRVADKAKKKVFPVAVEKLGKVPRELKGRFVMHVEDLLPEDFTNCVREFLNGYGCKGNPRSVKAFDAQFGHPSLDYTIEQGICEITGYHGKDGRLIVPDSLFGYPVKSIGYYAFAIEGEEYGKYLLNETITSAEIAEGVVSIGAEAFTGCSKLRSIQLPSTLTTIHDGAFEFCRTLESIELPEGLTEINKDIFFECTSLESVYIPESVNKIPGDAFDKCSDKLTIIGKAGSEAERFANEKGIRFRRK